MPFCARLPCARMTAEPYSELASTYLKVGEFSKGIQYADEAVKRSPEDPFLYGLLGTMYFKVGQYSDSVLPLRMAMRGGLTQDGVQVQPLPLDGQDAASVAYFSRFGIALAIYWAVRRSAAGLAGAAAEDPQR